MASHIGKLPVTIPAGVEVAIEGQNFSAKGAKGSDSYVIPEGITAQVEGNEIILTAADDLRPTRAKHGLSRSIIASMVKGVHDGFEKRLLIVGTGYRAVAKGKGIEFSLGTRSPSTRRKASLSNCRTLTKWSSRAPTSRSLARSPLTSASCALRNPTRARASSTRTSASCARPERLVSDMSVKILGKGKKVARLRRHARLRKKVVGTPERPRLVVTRSNRHMVAQIVDDTKGHTLVSASTLTAEFAGFEGTKSEAAKKVGLLVAEKAKAAGIEQVVFDRGGNKYTGRVAAVADGAREGGLAL